MTESGGGTVRTSAHAMGIVTITAATATATATVPVPEKGTATSVTESGGVTVRTSVHAMRIVTITAATATATATAIGVSPTAMTTSAAAAAGQCGMWMHRGTRLPTEARVAAARLLGLELALGRPPPPRRCRSRPTTRSCSRSSRR